MNLWLAGLITTGAVSIAVAVMALVRRRAPDGSYFADSDRAAGVYGVLGTSFAVVLAFVIFLAFESYGTAKNKAGQEAVASWSSTTGRRASNHRLATSYAASCSATPGRSS